MINWELIWRHYYVGFLSDGLPAKDAMESADKVIESQWEDMSYGKPPPWWYAGPTTPNAAVAQMAEQSPRK